MKRVKLMCTCLACVIWAITFQAPAAAAGEGEVFDLGQVLVMEKSETTDKITTTDVVSIDDIKLQGAKTVADALEFVPGVDIQTGGKGQSGLKLRGFDQRDVKLLIDGVPAHESYDGSLDLGQIPVDSIAKIVVSKGASSVLYGPNTLGGVVNIITKKGGETPHTDFTVSGGDNDTRNYIFNHGGSKGKVNYWVTASHRKTDGFEVSDRFDPTNPKTGIGSDYNEDGGLRDLSYYEYTTISSKIGYEYDNDSKIYLAFNYHDNEKGCRTENQRYWEFNEWKQWHLNLVGEHDVNDLVTLKARAYYVDHVDTIEDVSWDADHTTSKKWFETSSYDDYTVGGELHAYLDFGDVSLVRAGITYLKDNHKQQDYYDDDTRSVIKGWDSAGLQPEEEYEADIYSFGIEDEIRLFEKFIFKAGISYDVHDPVKSHVNDNREDTEEWNPQAGVSYEFSDDFNVYASVGKKTRFPQLKELYSDLVGGNTSLKAQETIAYEIGADKRFNEIFDLSVAAFFNDIENRIVMERINGDKVMLNKGETEIEGFEANLGIAVPFGLDLNLGYTFMSSEERDDAGSPEEDAEFIPDHKFTLDARYRFDFGLTAAFQLMYTGEQTEYDNDTGDPIALDHFVLLNARLNQEWAITEKVMMDLFLEVKNIADENYDEGSGPEPGRSFLVGASVSF